MSITRIVAARCTYCGKPIIESSEKPDDAWTTLLDGRSVHAACANRATKARAFSEEEPPGSS